MLNFFIYLYTMSTNNTFILQKNGNHYAVQQFCGICGEQADELHYVAPNSCEYKDMKICLLYEVLCTRQGFFVCESCRKSLSDCAKKIEDVCNSGRSYDIVYKKGCCMCGGEYNIQVFKILNRRMAEKVLRRLKRQHMFNTIFTNKICSNCNVMFLELVKIHTLLHNNMKNCENCKESITTGHFTLSTKSKKIQVGGDSQKGNSEKKSLISNCNASAQTSLILVNDKETQIDVNIMNRRAKCRVNVTPEKKLIANNKEQINKSSYKVTSNINQQSTIAHASTQTSLKLPNRLSGRKKLKGMNSILLVNSKSKAQKEGAPRTHHSEDMNSQLCKKVAFKNPLLPTPQAFTAKIKQRTQTSALKYKETSHRGNQEICIIKDFSKISIYRSPALLKIVRKPKGSPTFYNMNDVPNMSSGYSTSDCTSQQSPISHRGPQIPLNLPNYLCASTKLQRMASSSELNSKKNTQIQTEEVMESTTEEDCDSKIVWDGIVTLNGQSTSSACSYISQDSETVDNDFEQILKPKRLNFSRQVPEDKFD